MVVTIITDTAFPHGDPGASRIVSYAKELVVNGHNVKVLCILPTMNFNAHKEATSTVGVVDNVPFEYTSGTPYWSGAGGFSIKKLFLIIKSCCKIWGYIHRNRKNIELIQTYTSKNWICFFVFILTQFYGKCFIAERSEMPQYCKFPERYSKAYKIVSEFTIKLPNAWLLETQNLADYYIPRARKNAKLVIVPMTVDIERFVDVPETENPYGKYIAYCGNMLEYDGISILIRAFSLLAAKYTDIKLVLAGSSADTPNQKELAKGLGIADKVVFLGKIPGNEVPSLLRNAAILALASPTSLRACATMPCKVGEYLCTGNPVVVTGLGEINKYLVDGVSAFLAQPDSPDKFAEKMDEALSDYQRAKEIAIKGKEVALEEFNSKVVTEKLEQFYKKCIGEK